MNLALLAHRSMDQLRNRRDIATLLREAVSTVRQLTGFDRVMAYRFHQDDSGEVVAEERLPELEPFLHRRFPASDIPPQARALYVRNPLRLIADIDDDQVPIDAEDATARPLDLTYSVLRSVIRIDEPSFFDGVQPSVNRLFSAAAVVYGSRVIAVVLSGNQYDGVQGMKDIAAAGGVTIVQEPDDASAPQMPRHVLQNDHPQYRVKASEIEPLVRRLIADEM